MMKSIGSHLTPSSWIDYMTTDQLVLFTNLDCCPDCGSLATLGVLRCHECGLFHYDLHELPERDPPPIEQIIVEKPDLDPSMYSLNPLAKLPESEEEEPPDPTINWFDSSTDFSFDEQLDIIPTSTNEVDVNE
ncbi:MAG TPA: hypothetical protein QF802_05680 [Candidatus Thalassarchaeaceae archaeon]|nr:hypothetical protein [Candidatus Thalassarchaeaceae archaeon]